LLFIFIKKKIKYEDELRMRERKEKKSTHSREALKQISKKQHQVNVSREMKNVLAKNENGVFFSSHFSHVS
jgi:hypothetical protein